MGKTADLRGGPREGAGRKKSLSFTPARLTLRVDQSFVVRVDRARRLVQPPAGLTRTEFLRRALATLVTDLEADKARIFVPPITQGKQQAIALEIDPALRERAEELVRNGRATRIVDLVRGAGAMLAERLGV